MTLHLHHVPEPDAPKRVIVPVQDGMSLCIDRWDDRHIQMWVVDDSGWGSGVSLTNADAQALIDALHSVRGGTHA